ncbi:unnamed protein product [Heligmosomoides polygyrus]|uniref:EB domain-containing protein n=1 Tax=Heligmosomoides polygyrus TaxID=6339 RepID=A0A183GET7_HELPZ|nr:unnamed protein product [Heligmosomoides polygyrus]
MKVSPCFSLRCGAPGCMCKEGHVLLSSSNSEQGCVPRETCFRRRGLHRTGGFFHSRIPRASISNAYLGLHALESRRKEGMLLFVKMLLRHTVQNSGRFHEIHIRSSQLQTEC